MLFCSNCQQLHTSPNLNSHAPMDTLREIENGLPSIKVSATALSPPTNHYNQSVKTSPSASYKPVQSASGEAPPNNIYSQSATTSATPSASYKPVQSASQKQVAFATGKKHPQSCSSLLKQPHCKQLKPCNTSRLVPVQYLLQEAICEVGSS